MIYALIVTILEITGLLLLLKSEILLEFLSNIPFFENIVSFFEKYYGLGTGEPVIGQGLITDIVKALLFAGIFAVVERFFTYLFKIGKHEYKRSLKEIVYTPVKIIGKYFFSALITAFLATGFEKYIIALMKNNQIIINGTIFVLLLVILVMVYKIMGFSIGLYLLWMLATIIFPAVMKLLSMEILIVHLHFLLNVPGMLDQTGSSVIAIIGIVLCISCIGGVDIFGDKADNYIKKGH